jgi:diguanylate cyclase (GGDEF)-like protein/PAS domain S-box-containing protein
MLMDGDDHEVRESLDLVGRLLGVARRQLGMELSWMSSFRDGDQVFEVLDASEASAFGLQPGDRGPLSESYCIRVVSGELPQLVPDTSANQITAQLAATREGGIGSYAGAPIRDARGEVLGMVCCVSSGPAPQLGRDDVRVLELIAELVGEIVSGESPTRRRESAVRDRVSAAIAETRFEPVFQPIVSMTSGEMIGVEALTRFDEEPSRPDLWFGDAASVGLGVELELAAMGAALEHLEALPDGVYMALNASPATLSDPRLVRLISESQPSRVLLEVTEHAEISDYAALVGSLQLLRDRGVRVAVDDVGAGFSSFAHVLELSPHVLKMDISITRSIDVDPARRALAEAIVEVAGRLGAMVVAEGVETTAELEAVEAAGVTCAQGYLFAEPSKLPFVSTTFDIPRSIKDEALEDPDGLIARQFELAMRHSPIGIALVALDGTFLHTNPALAAMLGTTTTELLGKTFQDITHTDDLDIDLTYLVQCLDGSRNSYRIDKRYVRCDGAIVWVDLSVVLVRGRNGEPRYFVSQIVDITERRNREDDLALRAVTDHLTDLPNRAAAEQIMSQLANDHVPFGVLFCDLSDFRAINDSYGHTAGDAVLANVALRLRDLVRDDDTAARWGGNEFLLVLPDIDAGALADVARRVAFAGGHPIPLDDGYELHSLHLAIGTAYYDPAARHSVEDVIDTADLDMYDHRQRFTDRSLPRRARSNS